MRRALAALAVILLLGGACTGGESPRSSARSPGRTTGGTLRLISYQDAYEFDPQLSYSSVEWELFRCCLLRTLMSYSGMPTRDGGAEVRPDLADAMPRISADGLTWTFRIKRGIRYGPPLGRTQVVAGDFIRALEREARVAPPGFTPASYYSVIRGFDAYRHRSADSISGLHAPDDHTLVVDLTRDTGDLGYRLSLPASAPIPPLPRDAMSRFGVATGHPDVGAFLVASGPYMIEGAENTDHDDPQAEPVWDLGDLNFVRNPSWSPGFDPIRPALVERIEIVPLPDRGAAGVDAVTRGEIDVMLDPMLATARDEAFANPELRSRLREVPYPTLFFIPLNLAQPPFDDVAVRRAVNAAIDREALVAAFDPNRGSSFVPVAHVFPEVAVAGLLRDYVPAGIGTGAGDPDAARAMMQESTYDTDGDGRCDGDVCTVLGNAYGATTDAQLETVEASLGELGIQVEWVDDRQMADPAAHVAMAALFGWTADYPSANDFGVLMTDPGTAENLNFSLIGASPEELEAWGYTVPEVPSVDDKISACRTRGGSAAFSCWAELDQLMSEQVVAWIPVASHLAAHLISERIDRFEFAGSETIPALERISLHPVAPP